MKKPRPVSTPVLVNAQEDSRCEPPGDHALAHLQVGDRVRLVALVKPAPGWEMLGDAVRDPFWVRIVRVVTRTSSPPATVGPTEGSPGVLHGEVEHGCGQALLERGDVVAFHRYNVSELA